MGSRKLLLGTGLTVAILTGCAWPGPLTINVPAQQAQQPLQPQPMMARGDTFAPLAGCAQQRGWATERMGDLVQVRYDNDSVLQFHYDNNHNMVLSVRFLSVLPANIRAERSEAMHMRGNEIYQCAGYGTPVYVGVQESPPPQGPVVYAAQPEVAPMPREQPVAQAPAGPLCLRLSDCMNDLKREACQARDPHCNDRYQYRSNYTEQQCQIMLDEMSTHVADQIRQAHPGFVMPATCHR